MNQYTTTPKDSRTYDANGNLLTAVTSAGTRSYTYDYHNMMVGFEDEGGIVSEYRYDALGRRIEKVVDAEGTPVTTRYLHNSRWQVIEERNGSNAVQATYIHGAWIDETIQMKRGTTASYYLQDDLFSTVGVVDNAGALVETVEYADYGEPLIRNATGLPVSQSTVGNARLFTGREWDSESRLYNYRTRYMDSEAGRFLSIDKIGSWGDFLNLGNAFGYVGQSPEVWVDPLGYLVSSSPPSNVAPGPAKPPAAPRPPAATPPRPGPARPTINPTTVGGGAAGAVSVGGAFITASFGLGVIIGLEFDYLAIRPAQLRTPGSQPKYIPYRKPGADQLPEACWLPAPDEKQNECTETYKARLQALKNIACNGAKGCEDIQDYWNPAKQLEVRRRFEKLLECLKRRRQIMDECYNGGDFAHRLEYQVKYWQMIGCWEKLLSYPKVPNPAHP